MSTGVDVRPAVPDDADGIAEVHVASWRGAYKGLLPAAMLDALFVERRAKQWREELAKADQTTWVAVQAERVVGFASVGGSRDADTGPGVGELYAIYVIPPAWGRSVGHAHTSQPSPSSHVSTTRPFCGFLTGTLERAGSTNAMGGCPTEPSRRSNVVRRF